MSRVLVTGASRGLGRVVAMRLAELGRPVTVAARDSATLQHALADLDPVESGEHAALTLDVADAAAWEAADLRDVTGLVCAAGTIGPIGDVTEIDPAAFEQTLRVNLLGPVLALRTLAPQLRASGGAAVLLSGGGATGPFARFDAYATSKVATVRLAENLAATGLRVNAVAPGFLVTAMQADVLDAGVEAVGETYFEKVRSAVADNTGDDPARAAELIAFLLSDAAQGIAGKLISAPWDPWDDAAFQARLRAEPDLATLRRIDDQFFTNLPRSS
ncbi:MAG TPA: SDR family oxidoreductase [Baekduia sp.]|nr:SDR family oxidoreductase [Baekduia sp.]